MDLKQINKLAFENLGDKSSHAWKEKGNKYYHGQRVAKIAVTLRNIVLPSDHTHDGIITVAAWFHDIMNGAEDHAKVGAVRAKEILADYCSEAEMREIFEMIYVHDDRYSGRDTFSKYIKLHQDADHLDHFGTFDIWVKFLYAASHDESISDTADWFKNIRLAENERYRNELNFEVSKKIFDEKMQFLESFTERFSVESSGGIWNLDQLLSKENGHQSE